MFLAKGQAYQQDKPSTVSLFTSSLWIHVHTNQWGTRLDHFPPVTGFTTLCSLQCFLFTFATSQCVPMVAHGAINTNCLPQAPIGKTTCRPTCKGLHLEMKRGQASAGHPLSVMTARKRMHMKVWVTHPGPWVKLLLGLGLLWSLPWRGQEENRIKKVRVEIWLALCKNL